MMYKRFALSLRNAEVLLHERGIGVSHEAGRFWWHSLDVQPPDRRATFLFGITCGREDMKQVMQVKTLPKINPI